RQKDDFDNNYQIIDQPHLSSLRIDEPRTDVRPCGVGRLLANERMFPSVQSNALNGPLASTVNFGRQSSTTGSTSGDFSSSPNSYLNRSHGSASASLNSLRDLTGRGFDQLGGNLGSKDALLALSASGAMPSATALSAQLHHNFLGGAPGERNGQSSATCRTSAMGGETMLSDAEFPTLGRTSNHSVNSINFSMPTTSYQPSNAGHVYSKDVINALQRAPYGK
uniref:Uncharacterized protein n=1 Tax=Plectus sambesii TaxID=2011161 RepID=A0A914USZ1_9BILA